MTVGKFSAALLLVYPSTPCAFGITLVKERKKHQQLGGMQSHEYSIEGGGSSGGRKVMNFPSLCNFMLHLDCSLMSLPLLLLLPIIESEKERRIYVFTPQLPLILNPTLSF
jgi:hypothetical protein